MDLTNPLFHYTATPITVVNHHEYSHVFGMNISMSSTDSFDIHNFITRIMNSNYTIHGDQSMDRYFVVRDIFQYLKTKLIYTGSALAEVILCAFSSPLWVSFKPHFLNVALVVRSVLGYIIKLGKMSLKLST